MPSRHAIALRTVGRLLDIEGANALSIDEKPDAVLVYWDVEDSRPRSAEHTYEKLTLLNQVGQINRVDDPGPELPKVGLDWSELLRTLGQDLDQSGARSVSITGNPDMLSVTWVGGDEFLARRYSRAELEKASRRRASARRPDA